jgi:hypothetical protein
MAETIRVAHMTKGLGGTLAWNMESFDGRLLFEDCAAG